MAIYDRQILRTPIAVLDFETTGLSAGDDRVVEASVVRIEPGRPAELVFDSLINPMRPMAATHVHRITDADVADAPTFAEVGAEFLDAIAGCVVCAFNVYFDIRFLGDELRRLSVRELPPHFCLMYMRPMLGIGPRCGLAEACALEGVAMTGAHAAAADTLASAELLQHYLRRMSERGVRSFGDLAALHRYKFVESFARDPFEVGRLGPSCGCAKPRGGRQGILEFKPMAAGHDGVGV